LPKDDFYTPTDIDALRMENELLTFEVRFLKAQLAEVEQLKGRLEESERSATQLRNRLAEAERAEQDLVLLLRRLAKGPLGWFYGSRQNFRILERRYLDTDD
jgi:hypothetical protein